MGMSVRDIGCMYDEQFDEKMKIAKFLVRNLTDKGDVELARKWLSRASAIKSPATEVKKSRNAFLSYMIKVLRDGVLEKCSESDWHTVCDPKKSLAFLDLLDNPVALEEAIGERMEGDPAEEAGGGRRAAKGERRMAFRWKWSADRRTYVAVKSLPGRGALVYMAVSKKAGRDGWDLPAAAAAAAAAAAVTKERKGERD